MGKLKRRSAKTVTSPKTKKQLAKYVSAESRFQEQYLCSTLRKALEVWAGNGDLRILGEKEFGSQEFRDIYIHEILQPLELLLEVAGKLHLSLVWKNYPLKASGAVFGCEHAFGSEFNHSALMEFLEEMPKLRSFRSDSGAMQEVRDYFLEEPLPLTLGTLIRYAAACGYQANFYLIPKEDPEPEQKFDDCLTPSKSRDKAKDNSKDECGCDKDDDFDDDDALLRRLNYPI